MCNIWLRSHFTCTCDRCCKHYDTFCIQSYTWKNHTNSKMTMKDKHRAEFEKSCNMLREHSKVALRVLHCNVATETAEYCWVQLSYNGAPPQGCVGNTMDVTNYVFSLLADSFFLFSLHFSVLWFTQTASQGVWMFCSSADIKPQTPVTGKHEILFHTHQGEQYQYAEMQAH